MVATNRFERFCFPRSRIVVSFLEQQTKHLATDAATGRSVLPLFAEQQSREVVRVKRMWVCISVQRRRKKLRPFNSVAC